MPRKRNQFPRRYWRQSLTNVSNECDFWPFGCLRRKDHEKGCGPAILWVGGGYELVSRLTCRAIYGPPPSVKHEAAHSCGNGHLGCINPKHLSWKTHKENCQDKIEHGTSGFGKPCFGVRGSKHGGAKLSEQQVLLIRKLIEIRSTKKIAREFGVSRATITDIKLGNTWGWL